MTTFEPPEPPPPEVAEHLRHLGEGRERDWCRFCLRRRAKGGTGVLPEDYLPPVPIGVVQDLMVEVRQVLAVQPETPIIEQEAWDDPLPAVAPTLRDDFGAQDNAKWTSWDDPLPPLPPRGPCVYDGVHCWHWSSTFDPCCYCGDETDSDDSSCPGRLR